MDLLGEEMQLCQQCCACNDLYNLIQEHMIYYVLSDDGSLHGFFCEHATIEREKVGLAEMCYFLDMEVYGALSLSPTFWGEPSTLWEKHIAEFQSARTSFRTPSRKGAFHSTFPPNTHTQTSQYVDITPSPWSYTWESSSGEGTYSL